MGSLHGIEVDRQDSRGRRADILDVVALARGSPEGLASAQDIAGRGRFLDELAVDHHEDDRPWMLVLPGLGTGIPAIVAHLEVGWQWDVGSAVLQEELNAHVRRGLREGKSATST
jgi:hypothetical protein